MALTSALALTTLPPQMQQQWLVVAAVAVSWLVSCQAQIVEPVLALGALALLKGAVIAGYAFGSKKGGGHYGYGNPYGGYYGRRPYFGHHRWGRAAGDDPRQVDDVLLTSVTQLDPDGCLLKLLCLAQATPAAARTPYQASLVNLFAGITQAPTAAGAPFVQALQAGDATGKAADACHAGYPSCPASGAVLHGMLVQAWGDATKQQATPSL